MMVASNGRETWLCHMFLLILFALYVVFLWPTLFHPPWEVYNAWRQSDTYAIGHYFALHGVDLLRPQFFCDDNGGNLVQLEPALLPALGCYIHQWLGVEMALTMRVASLVFFLLSAVYLYRLCQYFMAPALALVAVFIYLSLPLSVAISRAILPEPLAMLGFVASLYYFYRWYDAGRVWDVAFSAVWMSLAIMEKLPVAFVGLGIMALFFRRLGHRALKSPVFYGYGLVALLPSLLYFLYVGAHATQRYVSDIAIHHIFSDKLWSIFSQETLDFYRRVFFHEFTPWVLLPAAVGLLCIARLPKDQRFFLWAVTFSMLLEAATVVSIIRFEYYLVFLLPLVSLLAALAFKALAKQGVVLLMVLVVLVSLSTGTAIEKRQEELPVQTAISNEAQVIRARTSPDAYVGYNLATPVLINATGRMGTRLGLDRMQGVPTDPQAEIDFRHGQGMGQVALFYAGTKFDAFYNILLYEKKWHITYQNKDFVLFSEEGS